MLMSCKYLKFLLFITFLVNTVSYPLFSDLLEDAALLEENGNFTEAALIYSNWLKENPENPDFFTTLIYTADIYTDPHSEIMILLENLPFLKQKEHKYQVLMRIAMLEELIGDIDTSQKYYFDASMSASDDNYYISILASASLYIEKGEYESAEAQALIVSRTAETQILKQKSAIMLSRIYAITGNNDKALDVIKGFQLTDNKLSSEYYFWIIELGRYLMSADLEKEGLDALGKYYPDSPESLLAGMKINYYPGTVFYLGLLNNSAALITDPENSISIPDDTDPAIVIQTGSFTDRVNAEYMVQNLALKDFTAGIREIIINNIRYFRVILLGIEPELLDMELLKLKDSGFEGFFLYNF